MPFHLNLLDGGRAGAASPQRDTANDGRRNRAEFYAMTHFRPLWWGIQRFDLTNRWMNRFLINSAILKILPRPEPLSTMAPYTSWESLTDRTYCGRHLPPKPAPEKPEIPDVAKLFARADDARFCPKSTLLFATFAQWFTDGFLRSERSEPNRNPKKNTSNHEIDLCQLYGLNPAVTALLREHSGGRLKADPGTSAPEELPPRLCTPDSKRVEDFEKLAVLKIDLCPRDHLSALFAMGGDRANTSVGYVMMNVLFFREHNRIAGLLADEYRNDPEWDDERLFQTARNILIAVLIKIVIEEYINHISPFHFKFSLKTASLARMTWFRTNWMAVEFNLLYRWHSLIPSIIRLDDKDIRADEMIFNNDLLLEHKLGPLFEAFSNQPATAIGLFNTAQALLPFEEMSIKQGRDVELATYNDYRENCGFPRVTSVEQ
ncbi:MAG: peroxide synthase, partial [Nocardiaceae bacterium]|nr:peroxide synthase [Nocardiaceae bacterium]